MKENRGTTVLLTVIGIATLLVAVVGATFAYFTTTVTGNDNTKKDITVNSATVGEIVFAHGNKIDLCDEELYPETCKEGSSYVIYPGAQEDKTFTVTADAKSTTPVEYDVYLVIEENTFETEYIKYKASFASTPGSVPSDATTSAALVNSTAPSLSTNYTSMNTEGFATGKEVLIGTATLGTYGTEDEWTLDIIFAEATDAEGNPIAQGDQGAVFKATIDVRPTTAYTSNDTSDGYVTTSVATTTVAP